MFDDVLKSAQKAKNSLKIDEKNLSSHNPKNKSIGKRSNPDYKQIGIYLTKKTHLAIKKNMLDNPDKDLSDLIEELIINHLKEQ